MPSSTIYLETILDDRSGELVKFLGIVSRYKLNIVEIVHIRERRKKQQIPVGVHLELEDKEIVADLLKDLKLRGLPASTIRYPFLPEIRYIFEAPSFF